MLIAGALGSDAADAPTMWSRIGGRTRIHEDHGCRRAAPRAGLATLAAEPAVARAFLVEVYAAGPGALARRVEIQQRFVELVAGIVGASDERQRFACEAIVAAVSGLVTQRICAGRGAELEELRGPVRDLAGTLLAGVGLTDARRANSRRASTPLTSL